MCVYSYFSCSSFLALSHRPFTLESFLWLSKENGHGHVGYTKIVCFLEKPVNSSRCRYLVYGRLYHCCYALESGRRKRETLSTSASTRVSWQLYTQRKSLSSIFYSVRPGGLFRARVRRTLLEIPVSPFSLSVERNQESPFESKSPQMCSKIRRARQIGKNQMRSFRNSSIIWLFRLN